ncbi:LysR family transcriptional regulator [Comamonas composti]|uniref:LysR family transcriptional regulator n=1 Tax=Comamonas composti TaxID=408558 RepID=UPI00041E2DAA|nr:LysR family transcriptional regulator [Comamonas composti]
MNLDDLHLALVIAQEGGLTGASARLGMTPATLSKAVTRLERVTKVRLFERLPRGMRPTEFGHAFLKRAQRIDLDASDLYAELRDLRQTRTGVLRCGIGDGVPHRWVRAMTLSLTERGVSLDLSGGMTDSLTRAVAAGELEFALIGLRRAPERALSWEALIDDPMVPIAPANHPLVKTGGEAAWEHLAQARWIAMARGTSTRTEFEANFQAHGLEVPQPVLTSRSSQREVMLMHALGALMLVPHSVLREGQFKEQLTTVKPEGGWQSSRRLGIVRRNGGYLSPAAARAIEALKESLGEH